MTEKANILFVDDERQVLIALRALFRSQYQVFIAESGEAALDIIHQEPIHVIVSDQRMPQMLGHELLRQAKKIRPSAVRLLLTGYSDLSAIMHSINEGEVFRFINKPWDNTEIRSTIGNAMTIALDTIDSVPELFEETPDDEHSAELELPQNQGVGILVMDEAPDVISQVKSLTQNDRSIYTAQNIEDALELLAEEEIGVIITDMTLDGEDTTEFIKLLKQQYPLIMTVVLTDAFDSETAVDLINEGRIYRFLRKPIADDMLHTSIQNGLRFYQANKDNPKLVQRQQVEAIKIVRNPSLAQKVVGRFKSLRSRFSWGR